MDSERRHELETNDLREFLDNFKDFWEKHGNKILITLIIVLGGFAGYNYYNDWQTGKAEEAYNELANATTAAVLIEVAGEYPLVHDEAMRRAGDLALQDARQALIKDEQSTAEKALKQAGSAYTAIAKRGETVEYQLAGNEGLAMVAIMSGKWDEAKQAYNTVIELAGETHLPQAKRAETGLTRIELLREPIAFAPDDDFAIDIDTEEEASDPAETTPPAGTDDLIPGLDLSNPNPLSP